MSPRTSTYSREELNDRVFVSVLARGPDATLAEIGEDVGLTGARVGQLFGSKENLMVAMAHYYGAQSRARLEAAMALDARPLERLVEGLSAIAAGYVNREQFPNTVRLLHWIEGDRAYAALIEEYQQVHDGFIRACLREAVKAGELKRGMIDELVEGVIAMANGAYFTHILRHDQRLDRSLRARLETLLRPYRITRIQR